MKCFKKSYISKPAAEYAIKGIRIARRNKSKKVFLKSYKCSRCPHWHLTSQKSQKKKGCKFKLK